MAGEPKSFFGLSATIASVVTSRPATELASCKATLTTLAGIYDALPNLITKADNPGSGFTVPSRARAFNPIDYERAATVQDIVMISFLGSDGPLGTLAKL